MVISLSGAHAYGFPSPDSDLDLKVIYVAHGAPPRPRAAAAERAGPDRGDRRRRGGLLRACASPRPRRGSCPPTMFSARRTEPCLHARAARRSRTRR
ncbi:MAG TPA: nucleotidyltransferase domain-containing protein, partial [Anaeromyxobacter sp.]|nr:nucleotidyltransferase domain-containing protein [Anaeromyxobacter sp.]